MTSFTKVFVCSTAALALTTLCRPAGAVVITMDGVSYNNKLSDAVAAAYAADDGPDVINIMVEDLALETTKTILNKAITINGDADADGLKADILVDVENMRNADLGGDSAKCAIEITAAGPVIINDIKLHPNFDNFNSGTGGASGRLMDAIRFYRSDDTSTTPTHVLNRVWVSGSDADNKYIPLDTGEDLYGRTDIKRWSRAQGNESRGLIHISKAGGAGGYNAVLNDCHAGLTYGHALNLPAELGHYTVNGGLYGHCGANGIRVSGDTITFTGSPTDRLRIVRCPNIPSDDRHGIYLQNATVDKMEYVDIATIETGNNLKVSSGNAINVENCRFMGKLTATANATVYMSGASANMNAKDTTFVGGGSNYNPFQATAASDAYTTFTDCIFTSENLGQILNPNTDNIGHLTFKNCAVTTDGLVGESLNTLTPITMEATLSEPSFTENDSVHTSPQYMLTLPSYDWSEAQGADKPGNLPGNMNVYRPSPLNTAYLTAASDGGPLVGGAGELPSRIDAGEWMLMQ